jgi:hypothetical protein
MQRIVRFLPHAAALASLAAVAACGTVSGPIGVPGPRQPPPPPPPSSTEFFARDFAWSAGTGANTLNGAVAYRTKAKGAFTCAGGSVGLTPATPLSERRIVKLYGNTDRAIATVEEVRQRGAGDPPPAYGDYVRTVQCDAKGKFSFNGLPDGTWFLVVRARPLKGTVAQGVVMMRRVDAVGGGVQTITLG